MATIATVAKLQPADPRRPQDARDDQGRDTPPNGDALMERILENMSATAQNEVLRRIASVPDVRRGKVLSIRRRIADGTYQVADRLDETIDRLLELLTC